MQINLTNQNPTFKQIKLSEAEIEKAKARYACMLREIEKPIHNYKMFDIFESHLNKEVELKNYKTGKERKYFSTNLYIKFFEILNSVKAKNMPFEKLIEHLNNYIEKFNIKKSPETDYTKLQDYNVTSARNAAHHMRIYLNMSKDEFLKLAEKYPFFSNTSGTYLKLVSDSLSENLGFTEEECIDMYKKNPISMMHSSNWLIDRANQTMKILDIKKLEDLRNVLKNNPNLLTFDYLEDSIKNISEFLDTEEKNVKIMIKTQPYIATMKFDHLKNNFYAMKDHINVDRNKMVEIAIMAPVTIAIPFDMSKKKYEDISKTIGVLPETFYNKANTLPAIYRVSMQKLEKFIDYISKTLGYTREDAADYIGKNINILSYNFKNIVDRTQTNFESLNQELNIGYDTYLYMLEENAWIMGQKPNDIRKNMKDVREYFNIDKKTQKRMFEDNPQLITYYKENFDRDITNASEYFKIDKEEYKQMCIIEPLLATKPIKHHMADLPENAKIMNISEKEFIELGKKHPEILAYNSEQIAELKEKGIKTS